MTQDANIRNAPLMSARRSFYPFNAEQTINILSEFGPLVTMFVVNAFWGINDGTWALIITTIIAIAVDVLRVSPAAGISVDRLVGHHRFRRPDAHHQ